MDLVLSTARTAQRTEEEARLELEAQVRAAEEARMELEALVQARRRRQLQFAAGVALPPDPEDAALDTEQAVAAVKNVLRLFERDAARVRSVCDQLQVLLKEEDTCDMHLTAIANHLRGLQLPSEVMLPLYDQVRKEAPQRSQRLHRIRALLNERDKYLDTVRDVYHILSELDHLRWSGDVSAATDVSTLEIMCPVCHDRPVTRVRAPCGHAVCHECSLQSCNKLPGPCPQCHQATQTILPLYLPGAVRVTMRPTADHIKYVVVDANANANANANATEDAIIKRVVINADTITSSPAPGPLSL